MIIVRVNKKVKYESCNGSRTSEGWIHDERETITPEVWFSKPILIPDDVYERLSLFLVRYCSKDLIKDAGWGFTNNSQFQLSWTKELVAVLNFALAGQGYCFEADNDDGSFIEAIELPFSPGTKGKRQFQGKDCAYKSLGRFETSYSPYKEVNDLKIAIESLVMVNGIVPRSWIAYLIENATEDISIFLRQCGIVLSSRDYRICQANGELFPCLQDVNDGIVQEYKSERPNISYQAACDREIEDVKYWYISYGAAPQEKKKRYSDCSRGEDEGPGLGYTQSELDDMYRDAFGGDPEAQWNVD